MTQKFSDADIDNLIASVEETLAKSALLSKGESLKKDDDSQADEEAAPEQEAPAEQPAEAPQDAAPEQAAPEMPPEQAEAPAAEAAPEQSEEMPPQEDAPPQEGEAQPEEGDQALEQEAQGQEPELSDEELDQIYGSLDPQELERHYMIIRRHLESAYAKAEDKESEECEEEKEECQEDKKEDKKEDKEEKEDEGMEKTEKFASLVKTVEEQKQAIAMMTKAFELLARPERKAIVDLAVIQKSETESEKKDLTKDEISEKINKLSPASLSKAERDSINSYLLSGTSKDEVVKIISRGGK